MIRDARILVIETTGRTGSVCVARGRTVLAVAELPSHARHAGGLHETIDRLVRGQGWRPDAIEEVYVSGGPGSFTGARIGITTARTLAWCTGAKLVRVPTVDALARNALRAESPPAFVAVALDAKRSQIFAGFFAIRDGGRCEKILDATMADPLTFLSDTCPQQAGVSADRIAVLGEGVEYHRQAIEQAGVMVLPRELWPARAESVHAVGLAMAEVGLYCAPGDCVPIYVRIPEPEEKWLAREAALRRGSGPAS